MVALRQLKGVLLLHSLPEDDGLNELDTVGPLLESATELDVTLDVDGTFDEESCREEVVLLSAEEQDGGS